MLKLVVTVFVVLHGLVHLLYSGQSLRIFELQPGMAWPDGSWAFSRVLGDERARLVAIGLLALAAAGFVLAGMGLVARQAWWRSAVIGAAAVSSILFLLFWDGSGQHLDNQGAFALLINAALFVAVGLFEWPSFGF